MRVLILAFLGAAVGAVVLLALALPTLAATETWTGQYYANETLSGTPALTREDASIDFAWGQGSPEPTMPSDHFSVRWSRTITTTAGTYVFTTTTDDGVRLIIDGSTLIDKWIPQSATNWQAEVTLSAGTHEVVMEYYEATGDAVAKLSHTLKSGSAWEGQYFANTSLSGTPALTRSDSVVDFDWGAGSPAPVIPVDNFSVRWTKSATFAAGTYRFATYTDDGVRLFVDGKLEIDKWVPQSATSHVADVALSAGTHTVVVEYFEATGAAVARASWTQPSMSDGIRINAGGPAYVDVYGNSWSADQDFSGGVQASSAQAIWNTTDDALYVNERAIDFSYAVPITNGTYTVRLHFAELFRSSAGVRQFDVTIEGTRVLSRFDIYANAGAAALITRSFNASVADGTLNIAFANVFDNAVVNAIDIYASTTARDLVAPAFAAIPEPENASFTTPPSVTLSVSDAGGLNQGYWRINSETPQPLFGTSAGTAFNGQFTMPVDTFNALPLGSHTLSVGASDGFGNATVAVWRFRKVESGGGAVPIAFDTRALASASTPGASALRQPTSIVFGPDGRLYVAQQDGYIHVLTLDSERRVTDVQRIEAIHDTPTTNMDGSTANVVGRHVVGIDFDPSSTVERPVLWIAHSDPRLCFGGTAGDCPINTDSGVITRLIGPAFDTAANRRDFVTGLPRSRELHSPNAVHFGPDGWLYITIGSDTNYGAPSSAFSQQPERYLSAAMLRFNVNGASSAFPLDVRNVTSGSGLRPGIFEMYATGYRNAYDFLWHSNGRLYLNGNAGNVSNGTTPGPEHGCQDGVAFDAGTRSDYLAIVSPGDHGGHPNPARGQCILDDGTMYTPAKPADANYRKPILHYSNGTSSDGMAEYTVPTFGGQMLNNIISSTYAGNQSVRRVVLGPDGLSVLFEEDLATFAQPVDVAVGSDGSIYVAEYGANAVQVMEPSPGLAGSWQFTAPLPVPTQEVGVVACAGKVYVMGGLIGPTTDTNNVWAYDPATNEWEQMAPYPGQPVDHPGAACINDRVYLLGGLLVFNTPVKSVYEYNPSTNTWAAKADMPTARGAMGVAVANGRIYAAGGSIGTAAVADMAAYDPGTNTWKPLAPMSGPRDHLVMEAAGVTLHAIGGRNLDVNAVTAVNERYDPATNSWTMRAPMPVARAAMASGALHGRIQIWGGEGPSGTSTSTYPQGHDYDPRTNTWITIASQPTPRHGTDGATLNDHVHVPGGGPQQGSSVSDAHEVFSYMSTEAPTSCIAPGSDPHITDSDADSYTDQDESDNGTDPCSSASRPADSDADGVSDRNDPDDDNDGILDLGDQFQLDPKNGTDTALPWVQQWNPGDPPAGSVGNTGFTGVQLTSQGTGFIADLVHAGGAGGYLTLDATAGTRRGSVDSQDNALQVGFDARSSTTITTRLSDPMVGHPLETGNAGGIYFGLDEDNFVELTVSADTGGGGTGIVLAIETSAGYSASPPVSVSLPGPTTVDLRLRIDPSSELVVGEYRVNATDGSPWLVASSVDVVEHPALGGFFKLGAAAGIATSRSASSSFALAYDYFRLEASAAQPLAIATSTLPGATAGQPYNQTLSATGGIPPYTWTVVNGSLPSGVTLSTSGALTGTPSSGGSYSFTVRAADSASPQAAATKQFVLSVAPSPLTITTSSLPSGKSGVPYSTRLVAAGGTPPYTWTLTSGDLPPGLELSTDGLLSGTPTSGGNYSFTSRVTDASNPQQAATKVYSLRIRGR